MAIGYMVSIVPHDIYVIITTESKIMFNTLSKIFGIPVDEIVHLVAGGSLTSFDNNKIWVLNHPVHNIEYDDVLQ